MATKKTVKLRDFKEGKIKIVDNEPVIAFQFTGNEPLWALYKASIQKAELATKLAAKMKPLDEELKALVKDLKNKRNSFWQAFDDSFNQNSVEQLGKFHRRVNSDTHEFYLLKEVDDKIIEESYKTGEAISKFFSDEQQENIKEGKYGEPVGGFILKKTASEAEMRAKIREEVARVLPERLKKDIETITDKMVTEIRKDKDNGQGGFSINTNTGEVERVI